MREVTYFPRHNLKRGQCFFVHMNDSDIRLFLSPSKDYCLASFRERYIKFRREQTWEGTKKISVFDFLAKRYYDHIFSL